MGMGKWLAITVVVAIGLSIWCGAKTFANAGDPPARRAPDANPAGVSVATGRSTTAPAGPATPSEVTGGAQNQSAEPQEGQDQSREQPLPVAPFERISSPAITTLVIDERGGELPQGEPREPGEPRSDCDGDLVMGTESSTIEAYPLSGFIYPAGSPFFARSMSLIRRTELGCEPTVITQIAIDIATAKTLNFNNVEIRMQKVTTTAFTPNTQIWDGTGTLVWGPTNGIQMTPTGWKTFVLTTPFVWDSDNLLITWQGQGTNGGGSNYPIYWRGADLGWRCQCFSNGTSAYNNNMTPYQTRARYLLTITGNGACCIDSTCLSVTPEDCAAIGGEYHGLGSSCTPNPCAGACCYADGTCSEVAGAANCAGVYQGDGTTCPANCAQPGACCAADGGCYFSGVVDPGDCAPGDTYKGDNTTCEGGTCPQPGACCFPGPWCEFLPQSTCAELGGFYRGEWTPCPDVCNALCPHQICLEDLYGDGWNGGKVTVYVNGIAALTDLTLSDGPGPQCFSFLAGPGDWISTGYTAGSWPYENGYKLYNAAGMVICDGPTGQTNGPGDCTAAGDCSPPELGACCLRAGGCAMLLPADCTAANGTYQAPGVPCSPDPCPPYQGCPAEGTQWGQYPYLPNEFWNFGTSDLAPGYNRAEYYWTPGGTTCGLNWWGATLYYDATNGWSNCDNEVPMTFDLTFYEDGGGVPGNPVCTYTVNVTGDSTGLVYNNFPMLYFSATLDPCCVLSAGWIGIQATSVSTPDCWFLWAASPAGDHASAFKVGADGWAINPDPYFQDDLAVCLTGPGGAGCATMMGDLNSDTLVDGADIQGFVDCAVGAGANCGCGDFTGNGAVDESDIPGFIGALLP